MFKNSDEKSKELHLTIIFIIIALNILLSHLVYSGGNYLGRIVGGTIGGSILPLFVYFISLGRGEMSKKYKENKDRLFKSFSFALLIILLNFIMHFDKIFK